MLEPYDVADNSDAFTRLSEAREWKTTDGKTYQGVYLGYEGGQVSLMLTDKSPLEIPISKLSEADRAYVRRLLRVR